MGTDKDTKPDQCTVPTDGLPRTSDEWMQDMELMHHYNQGDLLPQLAGIYNSSRGILEHPLYASSSSKRLNKLD